MDKNLVDALFSTVIWTGISGTESIEASHMTDSSFLLSSRNRWTTETPTTVEGARSIRTVHINSVHKGFTELIIDQIPEEKST